MKISIDHSNPADKMFITSLAQRLQQSNDPNDLVFPEQEGMSRKEIQKQMANAIRNRSTGVFDMMAVAEGPKSQCVNYDPEVYAGCFERLDDYFQWRSCHWMLEKVPA